MNDAGAQTGSGKDATNNAQLQHCDVHHTTCALLRPQEQINDCSMRLDRARQALAKVTMRSRSPRHLAAYPGREPACACWT